MFLLNINVYANSETEKTNLIYCVDPDWFPFESIKDGKHIGISSDYVKFVAMDAGLELTFLPTETWQSTLDHLMAGTCHITPMLNKNEARSEFLDFSDTYFNSPNVLVSQKNQPFLKDFDQIDDQVVALSEGFRINDYIKQKYPEVKTRIYASVLEGLMSVADGETDIFVGSMLSTNNYIQQHGLHQLRIAGWGGPEDNLRFGVIKSQSDLLPLINFSLSQIDDAHKLAIYHKWNNITVIDNTNYGLIKKMVMYGAIAAVFLLSYLWMMKRYNRQLQQQNVELNRLKSELTKSNQKFKKLSTHDLLTGLYNRYYFDMALAEESSRYDNDNPIALTVIDIDYFKRINDQYGHSTGDVVLKLFAQLLKDLVNDMDVLARWGGEEFVIFSNNTSLQQAHDKCFEIQKQLKLTTFPGIEHITASYGIASLKQNETMSACFQRADQALYKAKDEGRDRICIADAAEIVSSSA
ncbi:diguanylate cyclase domain-containing protein [Marinicella rhabdoformis]|uniref:diguanylate cyclase domain-containing protein n=1 Tax=Marinicella rhabdoformis TaxID=2580566 RepID=UPI0012AECF0D|nr:diguanylate cyclase [Marinicella rhabdoformis]